MLKNSKEILNNFVLERIGEINDEMLIHNKEYCHAGENSIVFFQQIMDVLPDKYKKILYKIEENANRQQAIAEEIMYNQGIKDGIKLKRLLRLVK